MPTMEPKKEPGRSILRGRKTISYPKILIDAIQKDADLNWGGDFTKAAIEGLRKLYPKEVAEFDRQNVTQKHSRYKF